MIAHVAEKGEDRGRVVVQLGPSSRVSVVAIEAAVRIALAFQSEIESLFIEDAGLVEGTGFSFAREIAFSGRHARPLALADLEREWRAAARMMHEKVLQLAGLAGVSVRCRTVRYELEAALARVCAENGPWNIVVLAEPLDISRASRIGALLQVVQATTGVLIAGPNARQISGPVVALIEDSEHIAPMRRAAERIAAAAGNEAKLIIIAAAPEDGQWLEGQARLALAGSAATQIGVANLTHTEPCAIAQLLRQLRPGLVISQFGGTALPSGRELAALAAALEAPLLIVR